ncbi:MAG: PAS domain S-box protein [Tenuifilaceae bacterium]
MIRFFSKLSVKLAFRFSAIYIIVSSIYIFFSDRFVSSLFSNIETITAINTYKGWGFVFISGVIIYIVILRAVKITQEKDLQYQKLSEYSEKRYSDIYNNSPVMLHSIDSNGRLVSVSNYWLDIMGYERSEVIGRSSSDFLTPESREYAKNVVLPEFIQNGICKNVPYQFVKKNGEIIDTLLSAISEKDNIGKIIRSFTVVNDITKLKHTEKKLRDKEEFLKKIVQTIPEIIIQTDLDGNILYINDIGLKSSGFSSISELIGKNMMSFIAPEDINKAVLNTRLMFEQPLGPIEYHLVLNEFAKITCEINGEVLRQSDNTPYGMVYLIRDITQRKIFERSLKLSEEKFRAIVETTPNMIWEVDQKGNFIYLSPQWFNILGYEPKELIGKSMFSLLPQESLNSIKNTFNKHKESKVKFNLVEVPAKNKKGEIRILELHSTSVISSNTLIGFRGIAHDITERKRFLETLWLNEEKHRILLDDASDPIFSFDREGTFLYVNKAFSTPFGKNPDELINIRIWDIFSKEEANKRFEAVKNVFETGQITDIDVSVPSNHGDLFFQTTIKPIIDEHGVVKNVICISKNITERKRVESELQELNASKDKFFSIIAHDLKNPFNSIIGFSELLKKRLHNDKNEKASQIAMMLNNTSKETYNLLENLLEWANSQRGKIHFSPSIINLKVLFEEEISLVNSMASQKGIIIKNCVNDSETLNADEHMLKVIIRNLLTNAVKYSNNGGEVVLDALDDSNKLIITIADNGIGISETIKDKLFKLDPKSSNLGTAGEKGTGLGLIICKEFVEKHGGRIWVESQLGEGSKFSFSIPKV